MIVWQGDPTPQVPVWPCDVCNAPPGEPCRPGCPETVPEVAEDLNLY